MTPQTSLVPGMMLGGRYVIDALAHTGNTAEVWTGTDVLLDRAISVKALRPDAASHPAAVEQFEIEAQAAARVHHRSIVEIYDTVDIRGQSAIVMEFIEGRSLREILDHHGTVTVRDALKIGVDLCEALAVLHDTFIVHCDLKPANVIIGNRNRVVLADFGSAIQLNNRSRGRRGRSSTYRYAAPELLANKLIDRRADVYSLGVLLYELLAGQRPFEDRDERASGLARLNRRAPQLGELAPEVPETVRATIMCCLERDPDQRFDDITQLWAALQAAGAETDAAPAQLESRGGTQPATVMGPLTNPTNPTVPISRPRGWRRTAAQTTIPPATPADSLPPQAAAPQTPATQAPQAQTSPDQTPAPQAPPAQRPELPSVQQPVVPAAQAPTPAAPPVTPPAASAPPETTGPRGTAIPDWVAAARGPLRPHSAEVALGRSIEPPVDPPHPEPDPLEPAAPLTPEPVQASSTAPPLDLPAPADPLVAQNRVEDYPVEDYPVEALQASAPQDSTAFAAPEVEAPTAAESQDLPGVSVPRATGVPLDIPPPFDPFAWRRAINEAPEVDEPIDPFGWRDTLAELDRAPAQNTAIPVPSSPDVADRSAGPFVGSEQQARFASAPVAAAPIAAAPAPVEPAPLAATGPVASSALKPIDPDNDRDSMVLAGAFPPTRDVRTFTGSQHTESDGELDSAPRIGGLVALAAFCLVGVLVWIGVSDSGTSTPTGRTETTTEAALPSATQPTTPNFDGIDAEAEAAPDNAPEPAAEPAPAPEATEEPASEPDAEAPVVPEESSDEAELPQPRVGMAEIALVRSFDPFGDGVEHDAELANLTDGDIETTWSSEVYGGPLEVAKPGIGIALQITGGQPPDALVISGAQAGWSAVVYASSASHDDLSDWGEPIASIAVSEVGQTTIDLPDLLAGKADGTHVLVWFTSVPQSIASTELFGGGPGYQLELGEVSLLAGGANPVAADAT